VEPEAGALELKLKIRRNWSLNYKSEEAGAQFKI